LLQSIFIHLIFFLFYDLGDTLGGELAYSMLYYSYSYESTDFFLLFKIESFLIIAFYFTINIGFYYDGEGFLFPNELAGGTDNLSLFLKLEF
jgi:hypothetical protein